MYVSTHRCWISTDLHSSKLQPRPTCVKMRWSDERNMNAKRTMYSRTVDAHKYAVCYTGPCRIHRTTVETLLKQQTIKWIQYCVASNKEGRHKLASIIATTTNLFAAKYINITDMDINYIAAGCQGAVQLSMLAAYNFNNRKEGQLTLNFRKFTGSCSDTKKQ